MLFVIHGHDRLNDGAALRRRIRAAHLRFVLANPGVFRYGGPLLDDEGQTVGSLMLVDLPDRKALDRFLQEEPYCRNGLFAPLHVHPSRQVVPEIAPGLLAKELAREELAALTDG
jgi:uncharacterized protein